LLLGWGGAQAAQLKLTGGEVGEAFEHVELIGCKRRARLAGEDSKSRHDVASWRANRRASEGAGMQHPDHERRVLGARQEQGVGNRDGSVVIEDRVKERAGARDLANALSPPGLDPDAAFVGKAETGSVGAEVFGGKAGNGVEAGLGGRVENGVSGKGGEPFFLTTKMGGHGLEL